MKQDTVKDLMVPISEYATVPENATLFDAVLALGNAREMFDQKNYQHRAVLILNSDNRVIGKLGQLDVLQAIEPKNEKVDKIKNITSFGFSPDFINKTREQYRLEGAWKEDLFTTATKLKAVDYMQSLSEGEYVNENTSLQTAIHQLVMGKHMSLLVTAKKDIVGILRMSDVFFSIFSAMKESETKK